MSIKKFFKVGVWSSILGATLGLLFAKKAGSKTRGELKNKLGEAKDKFIDLTKKAAHELKEMKDEVRDGAQDIKKAFEEDPKDKKDKK